MASVPPVWLQCRRYGFSAAGMASVPAGVSARSVLQHGACLCVCFSTQCACSIHSLCSFLLEPRGRVRVTWDVLVFVCLAYLLVSMPYRIGFDVPGACGTCTREDVST
jgi:hypothetical protein